MQLTYEDSVRFEADEELAPEETRNIPFFGFITGTAISLTIWGAIGWTLWAILT